MSSKVVPLTEAISTHVADGTTIFMGGFGHAVPFAAGHEVIRQRKRNLTLCRTGADILFDQLIAAGCCTHVVIGWIGNPSIGISHSLRRAQAAESVAIEEWTNFSLALRLHAAALGVPFLPTYVLGAGDIAGASAQVAEVRDPFSGEVLNAVPALEPDVALIHAQRADEHGNTQLWGVLGDTVDGALASRSVVVTVEEVVGRDVIRDDPNRTVIPGFRVDAVVEVPWGAHPSYVAGFYGRDDEFYRTYDSISRSEADLDEYLSVAVHGVTDRAAYMATVDTSTLTPPDSRSRPISYGFERSP